LYCAGKSLPVYQTPPMEQLPGNMLPDTGEPAAPMLTGVATPLPL